MRKRDATRLQENLRRSIEHLTVLERELPELLRRGEVSARADGWPSASPGFGEGGRGNVELTSVESAVVGRAGPDGDVVGRHLRDLVRDVDRISRLANAAAGLRDLVMRVAEQQGKRQLSVPDCVNCGNLALPRPKAGRCGECYEHRRYAAHDLRKRDGEKVCCISSTDVVSVATMPGQSAPT